MRIKEFIIENFKNIGIETPCRITFPTPTENKSSDFVTIIGENNVGKSSIFEALKLFLPETGSPSIPTIELFPNKDIPCNENEYMRFTLILDDLNDNDKNSPYLKPYIFNNQVQIRRTWSEPNLKDSDVPFQVHIPPMSLNEISTDSPFNNKAFLACSQELQEFHSTYCTENNLTTGTIAANSKGKFIEYVYNNNPSLVHVGEAFWQNNPNGFSSKTRSIMPKVIYVPAVKLIEDEADSNKNNSAANQLSSILFEQHLNETEEILTFNTALQNLQNIFIGESRNQKVIDLEDKISKKLNRLLNVEANFDFSPPETMKKLHLNSKINLKYKNLVTAPNQQGNGVQRMLILSLLELMAESLTQNNLDTSDNQEFKRPFLFMIEEPEIYLHPHMQRKMRDALVQISKHPLAQVICTSHSENFINLADRHQGIVVLKSTDNSTSTLQVTEDIYQGTSAQEKRDRMRMLLNFNSSTLEAFFARRIVLIEGDCELAAIQAIKDKLIELNPEKTSVIDSTLREVTIIPCNGKLTQKAYFQVLKHFNINCFLIHDLDNKKHNEDSNLNILETILSENFRYTHQPNFEGDIFNEIWERDKPWKATKKINNDFFVYKDKLINFYKFVIGEEIFDSLGLSLELLKPLSPA